MARRKILEERLINVLLVKRGELIVARLVGARLQRRVVDRARVVVKHERRNRA